MVNSRGGKSFATYQSANCTIASVFSRSSRSFFVKYLQNYLNWFTSYNKNYEKHDFLSLCLLSSSLQLQMHGGNIKKLVDNEYVI
ncbi:MAG: hypothetical protein N3A01_02070 [Bacteroidales bacterium]|nr:hypothetical protein [Bacteroidales bacterium]